MQPESDQAPPHSLFAQCHALAPPQHYYEACVFDSCLVPGSDLECASLQSYAALCAHEGICVDWRNHTHGTCRECLPACLGSVGSTRCCAQPEASLGRGSRHPGEQVGPQGGEGGQAGGSGGC